MEINVEEQTHGQFCLHVGNVSIRMGAQDFASLKAALKVYIDKDEAENRLTSARQLFEKLLTANDAGVQNLLKEAHFTDMVVIMQAFAANRPLMAKFERNMAKRSMMMFQDALETRRDSPVDPEEASSAVTRLLRLAQKLVNEKKLVFEG
jgi:flagellar motor switch protein FliG